MRAAPLDLAAPDRWGLGTSGVRLREIYDLLQRFALVVDKAGMHESLVPSMAPSTPPEGLVEMVCTLFIDDPVQMQQYAVFGARVDVYLEQRGHRGWGHLDVERFVADSAGTRAEAVRLCCMLAKVLPWLVDSGELTRPRAQQMRHALTGLCPGPALKPS